MNKTIIIIGLAVASLASPKADATDSLDKILSDISLNNSDLKATALQLSSDSIDIASTNYLEDPSVDFEYLFGSKQVGDKWAIGVSQGFDWPGIYASRRNANKSKMTALSYSAKMKQLEILYQAKLSYLDLVNINKQVAIWQSIYDQYMQLYTYYSTAYDKKEITILDINKLRVECTNVSQSLEDLKIQRNAVIETLTALNGGISLSDSLMMSDTEYPTEAFLPIETYIAQYREYDPESNYYLEMGNAFKAEHSVARMGWLPKFAIGYKYSNEIGDSFNGFTVGLTIPLFNNRKKAKAVKAQEVANTYAAQNIWDTNYASIKSAFNKALSLKNRLEAYKTSLDFDANRELLKRALDERQISLLEYIREMIYFMDAEKQLLSLEYEYQCAMAQLNRYSVIY